MNILVLNQYALPRGWPGITRHGDLGAELAQRGHQVTVIASSFDYLTRQPLDVADRESMHDGVRFVWLRTGAYTKNDSGRVRSMARFSTAAAWAALRLRPRPDVIVGSSPHLLAAVSAAVVARLLRRPWVFEVRDFWPSALADLGAIVRGGRVHRALESLERRLYADAAAVVSVPPDGWRRLQELRLSPAKCVHIPNASQGDGQSAPIPPSLRSMLDDLQGKFLILYTGALGVTHDLVTPLRGLAELRERHPAVYERAAAVFIGDGVERERIVAAAHDLQLPNVRFHGAVEKAAIPSVLSRADACLMQAGDSDYFKYGLSPNKLFDYLSAGKPVIIAAARPTIVDEAGAGIRFRPGDTGEVAAAVKRIIEASPRERGAMGERARELARTRYAISTTADQYETLLGQVVERHH